MGSRRGSHRSRASHDDVGGWRNVDRLFGFALAGAYWEINAMIEDALLLRRYADHHEEGAFAELVRRHLNLVYSAAMRRTGGNTHRAEDIAQFVFNELARNAAAVARHPALSGWLHTATRNAALNAARSERRRRMHEQAASIMNDTVAPAAPDPEWAHLRPVLDDVIDQLGPADRDAVVLRFLEGRPFAEIGRALRISEDAARMRTDRALEKLRRLLLRRGVTSTAAALSVAVARQTAMAAPGGMAATITGTALAHAMATGSAGIVATLWTALAGTKIAIGTTSAVVLVAAGWTVFALSERGERAQPDPMPAVEPAPPASMPSSRASAAASMAAQVESIAQNQTTPAREPADANRTAVPSVDEDPGRTAAAELRHKLWRDYAPLFDRLGPAPGRRDQLLALLVDERKIAADFAAAGSAAGVDVTTDPVTFDVSVRALREKIQREIETLLGAEGFKEYQNVRKALQLQSWADGLEKRLRRTPDSLSAVQSRQFASLLLGGDIDPKGPAVIIAASQFLSPPQILALLELQHQRIAGSQKQEVQDAVREGASQASPGP